MMKRHVSRDFMTSPSSFLVLRPKLFLDSYYRPGVDNGIEKRFLDSLIEEVISRERHRAVAR
jgi:hypothetical protein